MRTLLNSSLDYINWDKLFNIIYESYMRRKDEQIALMELLELLITANGYYSIEYKKIEFNEYYEYDNYKYSTSIIGSEEYRTENFKSYLEKIQVERDCVSWLLDRLNKIFADWPIIYIKIFFLRYLKKNKIKAILDECCISQKTYYELIEVVDYLVMKAWLLWCPPKAMIEVIG